ncbi:serine protease [Tychonema sp. LEGE 07203]|uniref:S1 family peptidase n=1 Tax=Tychonema sp. LEGE 07203 TaxID=1828671 RepID=UPI00187EFCFB|nr:serine protease [Tychonema sp. LEGE 07203]MBE9095020.1 trypsin-like peptidase domain-containing protein [Tychonema sp. LEGE 07203]
MNWFPLAFFTCTAGLLTGVAVQLHNRGFSATELVRTDLWQQPQASIFQLGKPPVKSPAAQPLNLPAKPLKPSGQNQGASQRLRAGDLSEKAMLQTARSITVKVLSGDSWGSGTIVERQEQVYTVLTNDHVLQSAKTYRIQTPDGQIYSATRYLATQFTGKDLAILQFKSTNPDYKIGVLGSSSTVKEGDQVYAAGFPVEANKSSGAGWKFTTGRVSLIPEKSLEDGYQLGYNNQIEKGMSGGPVLNWAGEVVAVNGMHAYPLWGDPYVFQDGSKPCEPMRQLMVRSSWGIPIENFLQLAPQFSTKKAEKTPKNISLDPPSQLLSQQSHKSDLTVSQPVSNTAKLMRQQAAAAKSCTQL